MTDHIKDDPKGMIANTTIQLSEWRFVGIVVICILILTSIPFVYAYLTTPSDKKFMGIMLDVPDHLQYFSWMRELSEANLAANKLTPEPNKPVFFNLLWWGLGRIGKVFGWEYPALYQFLRILATILFLPLAYLFCARYFSDLWKRKVAFMTICLTSGLGWIWVLLKYTVTKGELLYPLDVFVAEGNTFLGILGYPHFIAALLYIFVFDLVLRGERSKKYSYAIAAGFVALFLGWQHAYDLINVYAILAAYGLLKIIRDRQIPKYLFVSGILIAAISCWPAVYSVLLTSLDPLWKDVLAQFANAGVYTPNLSHLPILLGIAFILALITAIRDNPLRGHHESDFGLLIMGWFWVSFILVYLPVDYQIHLLNGWQIPIALLAVRGLFEWLLPGVERKARTLSWSKNWNFQIIVPVIFLVSISLTNVYLWAWRFLDLSRHDYPYYLYQDEIQALKWLETNGNESDVVLSSLNIGQFVPALTGKFAFLAHWAQTVRYHDKVALVDQFFSEKTEDEERLKIIKDFNVQYVFYGSAERGLGDFQPSMANYLQLAFSSPNVEVYRVR
jgi:hypothetical protein